MKKTVKILFSALLIASVSLTAVPLTAPVTSLGLVTPVSAAENSIQSQGLKPVQHLSYSFPLPYQKAAFSVTGKPP